jgi:hypothetical protein
MVSGNDDSCGDGVVSNPAGHGSGSLLQRLLSLVIDPGSSRQESERVLLFNYITVGCSVITLLYVAAYIVVGWWRPVLFNVGII